jgi:hypothetical protein
MPLVVLDIDYRRVEREGTASDLFKARGHGRDRHSTEQYYPIRTPSVSGRERREKNEVADHPRVDDGNLFNGVESDPTSNLPI